MYLYICFIFITVCVLNYKFKKKNIETLIALEKGFSFNRLQAIRLMYLISYFFVGFHQLKIKMYSNLTRVGYI